jgi:hypothetical protein
VPVFTAANLATLRRQLNEMQRDFGSHFGVSRQTIANWENGTRKRSGWLGSQRSRSGDTVLGVHARVCGHNHESFAFQPSQRPRLTFGRSPVECRRHAQLML